MNENKNITPDQRYRNKNTKNMSIEELNAKLQVSSLDSNSIGFKKNLLLNSSSRNEEFHRRSHSKENNKERSGSPEDMNSSRLKLNYKYPPHGNSLNVVNATDKETKTHFAENNFKSTNTNNTNNISQMCATNPFSKVYGSDNLDTNHLLENEKNIKASNYYINYPKNQNSSKQQQEDYSNGKKINNFSS